MADNSDFEVLGRISLQDQASQVLQSFGGQMQGLSGIGNAVSQALSFAFGQVIFAAINKAWSALQQFIGSTLEAATDAQVLVASFDALGASGEELLGWSEQMALTTPFPEDNIQQALRMNLAMGQSEDQAKETTSMWANLAAGSGALGADIRNLAFQWDFVQEQGTISTRVLRQFANQGIALQPILLNVASHIMGYNIPSLKALNDLMKQHVITWDQLTSGMVDYVNTNPQFTDATEKMGQTWEGLQVKFKNLLEVMGEKLGLPVLKLLSPLFGNLFTSVTNFLQSKGLDELLKGFQAWLDPLTTWIAPVVQSFERFFDSLKWGKDPAAALRDLMGDLGDQLKKVLPDWVIGLWDQMVKLWDNAVTAFGKLKDWVKSHGDEVTGFLLIIAGVSLAGLIGQVLVLAGSLLLVYGPLLLVAGVVALIGVPIGRKTLIAQLGEDAVNAMDPFTRFSLEMKAWFATMGTTATQIGLILMLGLSQIGPMLHALVVVPIQNFVAEGVAAWWEMPGQILAILEGLAGQVVTKMDGLGQSIIDKVNSFDWAGLGRGIIDGISNGVVNAAKGLADAAVNAVKAALAAAKKFLGTACPDPSPVFAELGTSMSHGLAAGVGAGTGALVGSMKGAVGSAAGAVTYNQQRSTHNFMSGTNNFYVPDQMSAQSLVNLLRPLSSI